MFPGHCCVMGFTDWLIMLLLWAALLVMVIWGIRRLFPDRPRPANSTLPGRGKDQDSPQAPAIRARSHHI